jgi:Ecdysteroid kinase-like family
MANVEIPERLNREFFTKVLQKAFNFGNTVTVESLHVQLASEAGDNYCSEIYRANLVYKVRNGGGQQVDLQQISVIVKDMPPGEHRGEILADLQVYEREVEMYWNTVPAMSKLLNNEFLSAKCLYATIEPCKVLVFQDLKALGFQMADRKAGLDYDHCRLIMQKLGKFHAASMVLAAAQPKSVVRYSYGIFNPNTRKQGDHLEKYYNSSMETFIAIVEGWAGYEEIVKKLRKMQVSTTSCKNVNALQPSCLHF